MSSHPAAGSPKARVEVGWFHSRAQLCASVAFRIKAMETPLAALVPSSLDEHDPCAVALVAAMQDFGRAAEVIVPTRLRSFGAWALTRAPEPRWRSLRIGQRRLQIDARLADGKFIIVSTVTDQTRRGPFVLDVPSRFLHPTDRAKLVASRNRQRMVADVAAHALPCMSLVAMPTESGWLSLLTSDPIAAELCAMVLAEHFLEPGVEMQAPWEDPAIQRATELELGARIPQDITFVYQDRGEIPKPAQRWLAQLRRRIGVQDSIDG